MEVVAYVVSKSTTVLNEWYGICSIRNRRRCWRNVEDRSVPFPFKKYGCIHESTINKTDDRFWTLLKYDSSARLGFPLSHQLSPVSFEIATNQWSMRQRASVELSRMPVMSQRTEARDHGIHNVWTSIKHNLMERNVTTDFRLMKCWTPCIKQRRAQLKHWKRDKFLVKPKFGSKPKM